MNEIMIPLEEYKMLLEMQVRVKVFSEFVNKESYSIDRTKCAALLGFELTNAKDNL